MGVEKFFSRLFSSNVQIEGLSYLINAAKRAEIDDAVVSSSDNNVDDTVKTVEVRQSFKENGMFYYNYMFRTTVEFLVSAVLSAYLWLTGYIEIQKDLHIICNINGYFFQCSGVPTQFYLYILVISLFMLVIIIVSTFFTICWLLCPWLGRLAIFMRDYEKLLTAANKHEQNDEEKRNREELLGDMYDIYYDNRDLRLLLDLLAATTGLAQPIRYQTFHS